MYCIIVDNIQLWAAAVSIRNQSGNHVNQHIGSNHLIHCLIVRSRAFSGGDIDNYTSITRCHLKSLVPCASGFRDGADQANWMPCFCPTPLVAGGYKCPRISPNHWDIIIWGQFFLFCKFHLILGCNSPLAMPQHDNKLRHRHHNCMGWRSNHQQISPETSAVGSNPVACIAKMRRWR